MSAGPESLYWFDYESFGLNVSKDRPVQFAGLRTNPDLVETGEPLALFCRPSPEYLPAPEACLITGITPQKAHAEGVHEAQFIDCILAELSRPGTCGVGYNNIRFDDELTRYTLYRNLLDPFSREWQNGNSRWDLLSVVRLARALRPEGLTWPVDPEGRPTLRLEHMTAANSIVHASAHDALSDVKATLALARRVKEAQPRLFEFSWQMRLKGEVLRLVAPGRLTPFLLASPRMPIETMNLGVVVSVGRQPGNPNALILYNLSCPPEDALTFNPDDDGSGSSPFGIMHVNRAPAVAPLAVMRPEDEERLGISRSKCLRHLEQLKKTAIKSCAGYQYWSRPFEPEPAVDVDTALYGGFPTDMDRQRLHNFRSVESKEFLTPPERFDDPKYVELCARFKARNYPDFLTDLEREVWHQYCQDRWHAGTSADASMDRYFERIAELRAVNEPGSPNMQILDALEDYGRTLPSRLFDA